MLLREVTYFGNSGRGYAHSQDERRTDVGYDPLAYDHHHVNNHF